MVWNYCCCVAKMCSKDVTESAACTLEGTGRARAALLPIFQSLSTAWHAMAARTSSFPIQNKRDARARTKQEAANAKQPVALESSVGLVARLFCVNWSEHFEAHTPTILRLLRAPASLRSKIQWTLTTYAQTPWLSVLTLCFLFALF